MLNYIKSVWDAIVEYQDKRATLFALSRLSDKELADIGVPRHKIYEVIFDDETSKVQSQRSWELHQTRNAKAIV
jgi:uncharacterized protein YjiS (DUF1127 family)